MSACFRNARWVGTLATSLGVAACTLAAPQPRPAERPARPAVVAPVRSAAGCVDDRVRGVLALANASRGARGRAPLSLDARLQLAAQRHADDMARGDFMSHEGSDGSDAGERAEEVDYDWTVVAENVAVGQPDPDRVMRGWMESPGHRDNLLAGDVRHVGIGYANRSDTRFRHYWVMLFADSEEPLVSPRSCG